MKSAGGYPAHPVLTAPVAVLTIGHWPIAMRGQAWQAIPQTPIFIWTGSEDIIHYHAALADLADKVRDLDMLRVLLVAVKGLFA